MALKMIVMFPYKDQTFDVEVAVAEVADPIPRLMMQTPSAIVDALGPENGSDLRFNATTEDPGQESDVIGEVVIAVANVTGVAELAAVVMTGIDVTK